MYRAGLALLSDHIAVSECRRLPTFRAAESKFQVQENQDHYDSMFFRDQPIRWLYILSWASLVALTLVNLTVLHVLRESLSVVQGPTREYSEFSIVQSIRLSHRINVIISIRR